MKLAAVGSNCADCYDTPQGEKVYVGGGPVNMAVYAVRLGGEASYTGPVGNDAYGEMVRLALAGKGVDVSHLSVREGKTAVTRVTLEGGERILGDYDEGVLADYVLSEEDLDFLCTHDVVVCDLWGKVEGQFRELKARGMTTAFDCATRPEDEASQTAMPYTDVLFFSSDGGDTEELRRQMKDYASRGPQLVVAMLGENGSLCFDGKAFHRFGIVPCEKVVDTMGAGDSYVAGFLTGYAEGLPLEECMRKGAACATETIGYFGSW